LSANLQENNMVLFDAAQKLCKFSTVQEILEVFYDERIKAYTRRKEYLISRFQREHEILTSKVNFIKEVINGQFKLMDKKESWIKGLIKNKFKSFSDLPKTKSTKRTEYSNEDDEINSKDYNYLLSLPIWNFCQEKVT
jgi:DNA topoisomerase-2